jgi:hypothetical protein
MRLAASGAPVAAKRRAVEPVNKVNILPLHTSIYIYILGVGIAQTVKRRATSWTAMVRKLTGTRSFFLNKFQSGSGAHPASYPLGIGAISAGVKRPGREVNHLPLSSAKVKNSGVIPPLPLPLHMPSCYSA